MHCHLVLEKGTAAPEVLRASVHLFDEDGQLSAVVEGITLKRVSRSALQQATQGSPVDLLYQVKWQPSAIDSSATDGIAGHWLILAGESGPGPA